jgi:hypothetical protein
MPSRCNSSAPVRSLSLYFSGRLGIASFLDHEPGVEQLAIRPLRFVMVGQSQLDQLQAVHLSVSSPANSTQQSGQRRPASV